MGKATPSKVCRRVTEVGVCAEAAGNKEGPIRVGRCGLSGCLETRQGRGVREA